jgi:hypothetical protein
MIDINDQFSDAEETNLEVWRKSLADLLVQANAAELPLLNIIKIMKEAVTDLEHDLMCALIDQLPE